MPHLAERHVSKMRSDTIALAALIKLLVRIFNCESHSDGTDLKPRPKEEWLTPARKVEAKISGQDPLFDEPEKKAKGIVRRGKQKR